MPRHKFKKGESRPEGAGRKKGTPNKVARDVKEFLTELVNDPDCQAAVKAEIMERTPRVMTAFLGTLEYVLPKQKQAVEVDVNGNLAELLRLAHELDKGEKS